MGSELAIVVPVFNRVDCLRRLLDSLDNADYDEDRISLVFSLEHNTDPSVKNFVIAYSWQYGDKIIRENASAEGLKNHILDLGKLFETYLMLLVLEDDLEVSPFFWKYAKKAAKFYQNEEEVFGVSLYAYQVKESDFSSFRPLYQNNAACYFMQLAGSWGQVWYRDKWAKFQFWLDSNRTEKLNIPHYIDNWGQNSWKRLLSAYLVDSMQYYAYPYVSYSSNPGSSGTHGTSAGIYSVGLAKESDHLNTEFNNLNQSKALYDANFELISGGANHSNVSEWAGARNHFLKGDLFFSIEVFVLWENESQDILATINSINTQVKSKHHHFNFKVFAHDDLSNNMLNKDVDITYLAENDLQSDLYRSMINSSCDIVSWVKAGVEFENHALTSVSKVFTMSRLIRICAFSSNEDEIKSYRDPVKKCKKLLKNNKSNSGQGAFFRPYLIDDNESDLTLFNVNSFLVDLINRAPLNLVRQSIYKIEMLEISEVTISHPLEVSAQLLNNSVYHNTSLLRNVLGKAFPEILLLPDLINYDSEHNSYYLTKY